MSRPVSSTDFFFALDRVAMSIFVCLNGILCFFAKFLTKSVSSSASIPRRA